MAVEEAAAEPARVEREPAGSTDVPPIEAAPVEEVVTDAAHSEPESTDAPPIEPPAEPPLRDRIPFVLPVELEAIKITAGRAGIRAAPAPS